jgi:hypothetical protein
MLFVADLGNRKQFRIKNFHQNSAIKNKRSRNCVYYSIYHLRPDDSDSFGRTMGIVIYYFSIYVHIDVLNQ